MLDGRLVNRQGFTIVELLIVIVIIGILAAITIVAYNGVQARANDSKMASAVNQIEKAIQVFSIDTGKLAIGGFGSTGPAANDVCPGGSGGFIGSGLYTCTTEDLLVARGLIPSTLIPSLPPNKAFGSTASRSLMVYTCGTSKLALYWYLSSPTSDDTNSINATLTACGHSTQIRDTWGMRDGKIISLL